MKTRIKYRLFLAILAATGAVVVCMFVIMQWSMARGFLAYVNTMEKERLERLAQLLEISYQTAGGWEFLRDNPERWSRIVSASREGGDQERWERKNRAPRMEPGEPGGRPRPDAPGEMGPRGPGQNDGGFTNLTGSSQPLRSRWRLESRLVLLDAERKRIMGPEGDQAGINFHSLESGGQVIGYLGVRPRQQITDAHQLMFVKQQKLAMALVAVVMLLVSAAIALPMSNRLVLPIRRLAASMHRLAMGEFETRVAVVRDDELGQLARDFNTLALSLEKNEQARRRWVADISHELRTPLSVLRGEIEAIQDGVRQANPDTVASLHSEVMQLSRLVDDLYQISLYDIGALSYKKSVIDLGEVLEQELDAFGAEFAQKGITLRTELAGRQEFPVFADPGRLQQLFDNLLENSLKYTDAGGELSVTLKRLGERAQIEFADSAPGVTPEELEKLFDRLYRVESSRNRALGGAGLGLTICKNIVEAHEGTIRALPSPKGGILISIELPLAGSKA